MPVIRLIFIVLLCQQTMVLYADDEQRIWTATSPAHRVAFLELYTSEGCSSCPPADRFLSALKQDVYTEQHLIPLAFHVTYWDYIGWQDRFGDDAHDRRQRRQAQLNASRSVYTPQFLMNGYDYRHHHAFNDTVNRINAFSAGMKIQLKAVSNGKAELQLNVETEQAEAGNHQLWLAVFENNLQSQVSDGENEGELLRHDYVVRRLHGPFAFNNKNENFSAVLKLDSEWKRQDLGIVAFVQKQGSSEIVQAVAIKLDQDG